MKTVQLLWVGAVMALVIIGCSVHAPDIRVTGDKTALENQILGTYEEINGDTWMIASTRAVDNRRAQTSEEKKKVLQAVQNRKFNKDEVDEFKRKGIIGENNQGLLEIVNMAAVENNPDLKARIVTLLEEENHDRQVIYERVIELNESAAEAGLNKVNSVFGKLNRDNAEPGSWVQMPDGMWLQKARE